VVFNFDFLLLTSQMIWGKKKALKDDYFSGLGSPSLFIHRSFNEGGKASEGEPSFAEASEGERGQRPP